MADLGRDRHGHYTTTYDLDYPGYPSGDYHQPAWRPETSQGFTASYELAGPIGGTHFDDKYRHWTEAEMAEPIRSGSSSGTRNNNPHPHKSFMWWKLPRNNKDGTTAAPAEICGYRVLTNQVMDQILKDQFKSTYGSDYLGIPQGYQVGKAIDAPADWRDVVPKTMNTTVRVQFRTPEKQHPCVRVPTTRYESNKDKKIPACGGAPNVSKDQVANEANKSIKTVYDKEFYNRSAHQGLTNLLNSQVNAKAKNGFMRYARIVQGSDACENRGVTFEG